MNRASKATLAPIFRALGDFHSTFLMFSYQAVALSGSETKSATSERGRSISMSVRTSTSISSSFLSATAGPARPSAARPVCTAAAAPTIRRPNGALEAEEGRRLAAVQVLLEVEQHLCPSEGDDAEHLVDLREAGVVEQDPGAALRRRLEGEADVGADPLRGAADAVAGQDLAGNRLIDPELPCHGGVGEPHLVDLADRAAGLVAGGPPASHPVGRGQRHVGGGRVGGGVDLDGDVGHQRLLRQGASGPLVEV